MSAPAKKPIRMEVDTNHLGQDRSDHKQSTLKTDKFDDFIEIYEQYEDGQVFHWVNTGAIRTESGTDTKSK